MGQRILACFIGYVLAFIFIRFFEFIIKRLKASTNKNEKNSCNECKGNF